MRRRKRVPKIGPTTYEEVKQQILRGIAAMAEVNAEAAQYLREHLVMDDENKTFKYTGDDRMRMERLIKHLDTAMPMQPKKGDVYVHCGHGGASAYHWFWLNESEFTRPDGSAGLAKWMVVCSECFQAAEGDPRRVDVRGDLVLESDAPLIFKEKS
jgi:rhodanese-related sulfurtransferase